ncbi:TonB-dependent receptor [Hymenobacter sp. BT18]|uniref:TonB-dependent receptor domain-containing protein n=1 Tax=Hymenobacter sp. BT18 TaxID=2835648 RepID=UPI00143E3BE8|nr:TonB-dependent receptor [Hymenobacter sp. BT18]QIX61149.1 TonB-dependent receptor [Hymenobacter sp. BT18]
MKHFATLALLAVLVAPTALAQTAAQPTTPAATKGTGRLTGQVLDAATQKPVEYATIVLLPAAGTAPLASTTGDEQGRFELKNLPAGSFRLQLSFVGYATRIENVTVTSQATALSPFTLTASTQKLGEVTVTGERPVIESKPDRLVYNADQDATNAGGTASDILRKTPMVNVDGDGNVQLRGTSNVRILINNKPSAMLSGNLAEALKQIPADQIKAIEVVTSPSAKYDAEGSGGVINIVLKKNSLQGTNGSVGATAGNRNQSLNGSLNAKRGKFGVNTKLTGFRNLYPYRSSTTRTDFVPSPGGERQVLGQLEQRSVSENIGKGGYGQVEFTYDPSPLHSFTLSGNGNQYQSSSPQELFNQYRQTTPSAPGQFSLDTLYSRDIVQQFQFRNYDLNAGYTRTFGEAQPRREWSVLAQHTQNRNTQEYSLDQYHAADVQKGPLEYQERSHNLARNTETTLQTDYTHPFSPTSTLEAGAKTIRRTVSSDYSLDTLLTRVQPDFVRSVRRSNAFDYNQNVLAAYATYGFTLDSVYNFSLGARLERTDIRGEFQGENGRFSNDYLNVLPNLSVSRTLGKPGQTLRFSYSRRIQRPQIYYLNPYVNQSTPSSISYGNPNLSPEITDSYELSYGTFGEKTSLNVSTYTRRTGNSIEEFNRYNEELARTETTFGNLATNTTFGLGLYGSWKPVQGWDISSNLNTDYTRIYSAALSRTSSRLNGSMNLNTSLKLGKVYSLQGFGGGWTGGVQLQSRYAGGIWYGVGVKRTLLKEKADLTLNASNFLQNGRAFRNTTETDQFRSTGTWFQYNRGVRLSFNYRFGKLDSGSQRQRRTIQNDDSKQGGSKGGQ